MPGIKLKIDVSPQLDQRRKLRHGKALNIPAPVFMAYQRALQKLVHEMTVEYRKRIAEFLNKPAAREYFALDDSISAQAKILMKELAKKFDDLFGFKARGLSEEMLAGSAAASAWGLKSSLKELSGGLMLKTDILTGELKDVVRASVEENVSLIKSIPEQYHRQVEGAVMRSITSQQGGKDLIPFLKKYSGITERRATLIAEDQTRKAYNSINRARLQKMGFNEFEWLHTAGSQHPRKLHVKMSGNIYRFDKPPVIDDKTGERGIPGQLPNCRCRILPVIKFEE